MRTLLLVGALLAGLLSGCGNPVCDKVVAVDSTAKAGACSEARRAPLISGAECGANIKRCAGNDEKALLGVVECLQGLPVCQPDVESAWLTARDQCLAKTSDLSSDCRAAFFDAAVSQLDGGADAGEPVDAGRQPAVDGGGAVELVGVADETDIALAWSVEQEGPVSKWEINSENAAALKLPEGSVPGRQMAFVDRDAGVATKRSYFVVGLDERSEVVVGALSVADAGTPVDAGPGCKSPTDCAIDQVCNLNQCVSQRCSTNDTCPSGYECSTTTNNCTRVASFDGGVLLADAGVTSAAPRPFVSEKISIATAPPQPSADIIVSPFPPAEVDVVAIDTARLVVGMVQEGQVFAHVSGNRGRTFKPYPIDTLGTALKLTYHPTAQRLFACYNVGRGVRVRTSSDLGRTWEGAADIAPESIDDGGAGERISSCDMAPWRDGSVLLATVDGDRINVRIVTDKLVVSTPDPAFVSSADIFAPARPSIATLPEEYGVHVGFSGTRAISQGTDVEPYAVYRDASSSGAFSLPIRLNDSGVLQGNAFPQDHVSLVTDPVSKRAVAAFTSLEQLNGRSYATVAVSLFNRETKKWVTGSDLSVFYLNRVNNQYAVIPDRPTNESWDAFSPTLAVTPAGKIFLSFLAGAQRGQKPADYHGYLVPLDFEAQSPAATVKGWFVPPAKRLSQTPVVDVVAGGQLPVTRTASAADQQLSVYSVFIEGVGGNREVANRPVLITRP